MDRIWVQGVVKQGQVVLDAPLDLPDGTIITVTDYDPDDHPRPKPQIVLTDGEKAEIARLLAEKRPVSEIFEFERQLARSRGLL